MKLTYAVLWQASNGAHHSGRLEFTTSALRLTGGKTALELPYRDLLAVSIGRAASERLCGRPALALERREGPRILIAPVAQPGLLGELAEQLTRLHAAAHGETRVVVVVPIKPEHHALAHVLVEDGPPFDPDLAGLERHEVFVTENEVVFLFETPDGTHGLERLLAEPWLWRAATEWADVVDAPPRMASAAYSWAAARKPPATAIGLGF